MMASNKIVDYMSLHKSSIVVDTHCDTLGRVFEGQRRLGEHSKLGQFDLPRAIAGGLTAELMATFVNTERPGSGSHYKHFSLLMCFMRKSMLMRSWQCRPLIPRTFF